MILAITLLKPPLFRELRRRVLALLVVIVPLAALGISILLMIGGTASVVGGTELRGPATDPTVRSVGNELFGDMAASYSWYRVFVLVLFVSGVVNMLFGRQACRFAGRLVGVSLIFLIIYAWFYEVRLNQLSELGPSPKYFELFVLPMVALTISNLVGTVMRRALNLQIFRKLNFFRLIKMAGSEVVVGVFLVSVQLLWMFAWIVNNGDDFPGRSPIPPPRTEIGSRLSEELSMENLPFRGRVLLVQDPSDSREGVSETIIYPSAWTKSLYRELQFYRVPMFNAYHHLLSKNFVQVANRVFTDGRPFVRQWVSANHWDRRSEYVAKLLGICFVASEKPLTTTSSLKLELTTDFGILYRLLGCNTSGLVVDSSRVGFVSSLMQGIFFGQRDDRDSFVQSASEIDAVVRKSRSEIWIERSYIRVRTSPGTPKIVVLPIEFDSCGLRSETEAVGELSMVGGMLVGLRAANAKTYILQFSHPFPLVPRCPQSPKDGD